MPVMVRLLILGACRVQVPSASSPDELAFVSAAEFFGLTFEKRHASSGVLVVHDKLRDERHEIQVSTHSTHTSILVVLFCLRSKHDRQVCASQAVHPFTLSRSSMSFRTRLIGSACRSPCGCRLNCLRRSAAVSPNDFIVRAPTQ